MKRTLTAALMAATLISPLAAGMAAADSDTPVTATGYSTVATAVETSQAREMFNRIEANDRSATLGSDTAGTPSVSQSAAAKAMFARLNNPNNER